MAFVTIEPTTGLSAARLRQAIENGPPEVAIVATHEEMLATAGFVDVESVDVTAEFTRTLQAWIDAWSAHEQELLDLIGNDALEERKQDRRAMRTGIDEHLLRRTLYVARRPGSKVADS